MNHRRRSVLRYWIPSLLCCVFVVQAFDISAYYDPYSNVYIQTTAVGNCLGDCDGPGESTATCMAFRPTWRNNVDRQNNAEALRWFEEMGVNIMCVNYPDTANVSALLARRSFQVMNNLHGQGTYRYMEAQHVEEQLADVPQVGCGANEACNETTFVAEDSSSYGDVVTILQNQLITENFAASVINVDSGVADSVFEPNHHFGWWWGWDREMESDASVMPLRITLRAKVLSNTSDTVEIGKVYFYSTFDANPWFNQTRWNEGARWVRFGSVTLYSHDFDDPQGFYGSHTYQLVPADTCHFYTASDVASSTGGGPGTYLGYNLQQWKHQGWHFAWHSHEYRTLITTSGSSEFSIYDMGVSDEAYWQIFESPDSVAYLDSLSARFDTLRQIGSPWVTSWYYDEWDDDFVKPMARTNKAIQMAGGAKFITNGWESNILGTGSRNLFYEALDNDLTNVSVTMSEFYPFHSDSTCQPGGVFPGLSYEQMLPHGLYTSPNSDSPYCAFQQSETCANRYDGTKSIQCAIDEILWGKAEFWALYGIATPSSLLIRPGHIREVELAHEHGSKFWFLLSTGGEGQRNIDCDADTCFEREASPTEIRLEAWLAAACDVDGIMWYWGSSLMDTTNAPQDGIGGLLEYGDHGDFCSPRSIVKTQRYEAAKAVCRDIQEIAPTLEALDFVKTYSSRAFKQNYPTGDSFDPTEADYIYQNSYNEPAEQCWVRDIFSAPAGAWGNFVDGSFHWAYADSQNYVQVSRFMTPGVSPIAEDYWFLVVNRRALAAETTEVCLWLDGLQESYDDYMYERILRNEVAIASEGDLADQTDAMIFLTLPPGEAELIHFHRPDTTDMVLTGNQVLEAPKFYNRNIILDGAQVTIKPDTAAQRYQIMRNGQWESQWKDSLEILFAPGKGIKLRGGSTTANSLRVLGNDSTQIVMKCAKGGDFRWKGIVSEGADATSIVDLEYATIADAEYGLYRTSASASDSIDHCTFRDCGVGIFSSGRRQVIIDSSDFAGNDISVAAFRGTIVRASNSTILSPEILGIYASNNCTIDLDNVIETGGTVDSSQTGMRSVTSSVWMKCSEFSDNNGVGFEAVGGSVFMADVDTTASERFGANRFTNNTDRELVFDGPISAWLSNGYNQIYDRVHDDKTPVWVAFDRLTDSTVLWNNNYWDGLTTDSAITSHLRNTNFAERGVPDCTPALVDSPGTCYLPGNSSFDPTCMNEGVAQELVPNLVSASTIYKNTLETNQTTCPKVPVVTRLLTVNHLGGVPDSVTYNYLNALGDTSTDSETKHAVNLGLALIESEAFGNSAGAATIYQQVIDSAGDDIYRKIDGQVGLLLTHMREAERDTVDGLTPDELTWYLDSLDQILGQRFVWSQYEITDSVVVYAPVRVDSVINVRGDGVLAILPHPGYRNPVVEFADKGAIKVWGTDTTKAKGKLYVYGQPDSRVTLHWEDSTGTKNIHSQRGFVKMKHAKLYGNGYVNQSQDTQGYINGLRRATFQADSCTFAWFDEGIMVQATDSTSYMRACTLAYMGGSVQYSGFGAGLIMLRSDGFLVEDCLLDGNDGVGVYHGYATDVVIRNSQIVNGAKVGVFGASSGGGDCRIECTTIASNGDTLPELRTYGVVYDLVGGHNTFSDSSGSLIYATDPSYVDLEEGENSFELLGSGRYLQSGDTNDVWDVTWNTWYPLTPEDSGFYSNLWPTTTTKWTIDSSLANFVSCNMAGTSSMGGDSWLIVGDDPVAGTMSTESDDEATAYSLSAQSPNAKSHASKNALDVSKGGTTKTDLTKARQEAKAERIVAHHCELAAVRALKKLPAVDRRRLAMMLVKEGRISEFEPVALGAIARGAVWHDPANTSSKFLLDYGSRGKDRSKRDFAKRLGYQALAQEGHPADAIAGLEELMLNAGSTRDSILALMDAMTIYYEHHNGQALQPQNSQIVVDDPYDLVRRTLFLSELLESGGVSTKDANSAIPTSYALYQNYPNPFNPNTEIRFDLPEAIHAELKVFNILGQEVVTLVDDVRAAGAYRVLWDGKNATGLTVASGVYIYQIKTPNFTDAKKMMLIR